MMAAVALGMAFFFFAAAGAFYLAPAQAAHGIPWAIEACYALPNLCYHPEWMGLAALGLTFAYVALRGIET